MSTNQAGLCVKNEKYLQYFFKLKPRGIDAFEHTSVYFQPQCSILVCLHDSSLTFQKTFHDSCRIPLAQNKVYKFSSLFLDNSLIFSHSFLGRRDPAALFS